MKICILGTGYVGFVSGPCFADLGNHVICVDPDQKVPSRQTHPNWQFESPILVSWLGKTYQLMNKLLVAKDNIQTF